jgi:general secretion pathway protein H
MRKRVYRGYTLIELLIVIFIISIVTSVALLSMDRNQNRQLAAVAKELMEAITLAQEQAMLQPAVIGIQFTAHAYQFYSYQPAFDTQAAHWSLLKDNVLSGRPLPAEMRLAIQTDAIAEDHPSIPQIVISTSGDMTPFKISLGEAGKAPRYIIKGEADGEVRLEK